MTAPGPVICAPVRTPIGRYGGMFKSLTAVELGVAALQGLLQRGIRGGAHVDQGQRYRSNAPLGQLAHPVRGFARWPLRDAQSWGTA